MKKKISDTDALIIGNTAWRVWEEIGYDMLNAVQEYDGKDTMPRADVIEVVVDAGRLEEQLIREKHPECATLLRGMDYKDIVKMLKPYFPFARYGM